MTDRALQPIAAWAEDRATQRCDPSADPGAKTGARARNSLVLLPFYPLRDWHESDKPSRHDAATLLAGCPSQLANPERQEFQFPLNQDNSAVTKIDESVWLRWANKVLTKTFQPRQRIVREGWARTSRLPIALTISVAPAMDYRKHGKRTRESR
jgi:hypothetical protein